MCEEALRLVGQLQAENARLNMEVVAYREPCTPKGPT